MAEKSLVHRGTGSTGAGSDDEAVSDIDPSNVRFYSSMLGCQCQKG